MRRVLSLHGDGTALDRYARLNAVSPGLDTGIAYAEAVSSAFLRRFGAFRCFLLRLGYIGPEYKEIRKRLLERLNGSSAFRTEKKEAEAAESVA